MVSLTGCGGGIGVKVAQGDVQAVKAYIASGGDVNTTSKLLWGLLIHAVYEDQLEVAELLIKSGIDVNQMSSKGRTPLFFVKSHEMLELLVLSGTNINTKDKYGLTAFEYVANTVAIIDNGAGVLKALIDIGLDPSTSSAAIMSTIEASILRIRENSSEPDSESVTDEIAEKLELIRILKYYKPIQLGLGDTERAVLEEKNEAAAERKRKEQEIMQARALVRQKEQAKRASIEYEKQKAIARKEQVVINKKAAFIKRNARSAGLESLFEHAAESAQICRHLSNIDSDISDVSCEYHVGQERTSKGCENLKEDIDDQLSQDKRSVCNVSRKAKNQLYDLYGRNNQRAVNEAINKSGNRISEREVKRMYPYVETDLSTIVDEDRAYAQEKHDNRPYETSAWASGAMKAMDRVSKSMPSTQESFRRSQSTFKRSIKKSKRSRYKSSYKPSKYRHVSTTQLKKQLASIDRSANQQAKRDAHAPDEFDIKQVKEMPMSLPKINPEIHRKECDKMIAGYAKKGISIKGGNCDPNKGKTSSSVKSVSH